MTDTYPQPELTHARQAADELLLRMVADGSMSPGAAQGMATTGFAAVTRFLAGLHRRRLSAEWITKMLRDQLSEAQADGDRRRINSDEFALAVWGGMQRDLAARMSSTGAGDR